MDNENQSEVVPKKRESSTGLDPKVAALLCYVLGWVTGLIFLLMEKENRFVKFHAWQSIITFGGLTVLSLVANFIPILGQIISFLLFPISLVLWIVLMVKAYQEEWYKLPVAGDIAENQLK
ncbi:DUF4870 domain-containing protein [Desmospora profundinema]|uniref:Membrane protein n=1 Tax=Desmospora profundinema TaxID=1571184 RepID=A0ABU1IRU1_9BACL|nr:DUF4870 domain-containing protein [Desmospora profundinema]MDR6227509.1 putative membrane protein [Desmospora profundinema]